MDNDYPVPVDKHGSVNMVADTHQLQGWGKKVKIFFSESSHFAYQIKRDGV